MVPEDAETPAEPRAWCRQPPADCLLSKGRRLDWRARSPAVPSSPDLRPTAVLRRAPGGAAPLPDAVPLLAGRRSGCPASTACPCARDQVPPPLPPPPPRTTPLPVVGPPSRGAQ